MLRNRRIIITTVLLAFVLSGCSFAGASSHSTAPELTRRGDSNSNAWLAKRVRHQLRMLPYYSMFDDLEYRVSGYHVELFGDVVRPFLKSDAEAAVRKIEGVEGVTNNIQVLPLSNFDDRIRLATARAIYSSPPLQRYGLGSDPSIHIIVRSGNVRLVGVVDSKMDSRLAYIRASSVPGVFSVKDELRID